MICTTRLLVEYCSLKVLCMNLYLEAQHGARSSQRNIRHKTVKIVKTLLLSTTENVKLR